jgi:hypothetical protein
MGIVTLKAVGIYQDIGRRLIPAFGNSDSDMAMIEGRRLALVVHHTDSKRKYAYDRKSHVGKIDKAPDQADALGWIIAVRKKGWKAISPPL